MIIFLYILVVILLLVLVLALLAPKTYDVSRSIIIDSPKDKIFKVLCSLKQQDEWSPWGKKDPNMHKEYRGTDGEVGSVSYWNGNKEVGEGEQEITKIVDGERIEGHLRFLKPWKLESDCYFTTEDVDSDKTKVTWGFSGKNKFPYSIMMLFMSMDKMVGKDFEEGLETLRTKMEG